MANPVAANVLGTAGAVCWSIQLIPQIVINFRKHDTTGLQPTMMLLWACAGVPLGVYNIVENFNIALRIQPQILTTLSLITWAQCKYYGNKWSWGKTASIALPTAALLAGVECGLVCAIRDARKHGIHWPATLMAVLSACLLCAGVLRHYVDIYKERTVRGISFIFVALDALGDLTSLTSIFFQHSIDVLGIAVYGSELLLWCGVMACGGYYNLFPWVRSKLETWRSTQVACDQVRPQTTVYLEHDTEGEAHSSSSTVFRTASDNRSPELRLRALGTTIQSTGV